MDACYRIRDARETDLAQLPAIEQAADALFRTLPDAAERERDADPERNRGVSVETFRERFAEGRLWVAVDAGDRPVGFLMAGIVDGQAHLEEMDVIPEHGRRGIGTALMERGCRWVTETGFHTVTLTTDRHVPWNAPFYARLGFEILEPAAFTPELAAIYEREIARGNSRDRRVAMRRSLSEG